MSIIDKIKSIECVKIIPTDKTNKDNWLELREGTVGGSEIGILFGENKYKHERLLFAEKAGDIKTEKISNPAIYLGTVMESHIASLWEHYNPKTKDVNEMHKNLSNGTKIRELHTLDGYIQNTNFPYLQGETDGFFFEGDDLCILEIKTQSGFVFKANNEEPPLSYLLQIQSYMALTNAKRAELVMLIDGVDFRVFNVERNDEVIEAIKHRVIDFYEKVLEYKETKDENLLPPVDESDACDKSMDAFYKAKKGNTRKATTEEEELMSQYLVFMEESDALKSKMNLVRNTLKDSLKEDESIIKDKLKCSWSKTKVGLRFQVKRLK